MQAIIQRAVFVSSMLLIISCTTDPAAAEDRGLAPPPEERQLPRHMHSAMKDRPRITVGLRDADINGSDQRALQAAVDYVAALGGGTVDIGPGEFVMRDSLHLRPHVTVRGVPGKTILRKADAAMSLLVRDGDYGEEQVTVQDASGFEVGYGVAVWDKRSGGFHTTVARITGRNGNTFSLDKPLNADCMVAQGATAATVFPVISGYDLDACRVEGLTIEGNQEHNPPLTGCRGAGIFLYRGFGTVIEHCVVRNYNGDGLSFQQSNDVTVRHCLSENNRSLGIHPGSGSQRPLVEHCIARRNGEDGLFLCWRVRHGVFQNNVLEGNQRFGISIGHKDTDNVFLHNQVRLNDQAGIFFRDETEAMAGHRNRLEDNLIENNGVTREAPGIRVRGETNDLQFTRNVIRDTREDGQRKQTVGVLIEAKAGSVLLENNRIEADTVLRDERKKASEKESADGHP